MKKYILVSLALISVFILSSSSFGQKVNTLTGKEEKEGWILLFNGKNFTGWRQCNGTEMPKLGY